MKEFIKNQDVNYKRKEIQVTDYVKNHKTGKISTLQKIKPVGFSINTCKIETFDLQGNVETESVSHNIVNDFQNKQAFWKFFYDDIRNNSNVLNQRNPFSNILLTDYNGDENSAELCYRGNVIGWANKYNTYAGSDILRGTINNVESDLNDYKKTGVIKTVFDFPTSAANGTINSVWWIYGNNDNYKHLGWPFQSYSQFDWGHDRCCNGEYVYCVRNSGIIYRYNMDGSTGASNIDLSAINTNFVGIEFDGTYFWLYDNTDKIVYQCNTSFVVQNQFTTSEISSEVTSLTIYNNKVFIATTANLYRYSITGTYETTIAATAYGFKTTGINSAKANNAYFIIGGNNNANYLGFLDGNGDLIAKIDISAAGDDIYSLTNNCFARNAAYNNSRFILRQSGINGTMSHSIIGGVGAHTKLASPVVKTNANTMKITYTFDIDLDTAFTW